MSREDRLAESRLENEVVNDGSRWVAPILRRNHAECFPPSYTMAKKRASALERKLEKSDHEGSSFSTKRF